MLLWVALTAQKLVSWLGLYILHMLSTKYGKNLNGIYRDDGSACSENVSGPQADRIRKDFIYTFRKELTLKL